MGTDILALQVRECAKVGGQTCVSPVRAIYNDLMENHPLVVHALARPDWPVRRYVPRDSWAKPRACGQNKLLTCAGLQ